MKPTYEQLEAELIATKELLKRALERIAHLEEKLSLNSKNSSKPPSTDQKGSSKSRKKNGAKVGHPGHFRPMFSHKDVDKHIDLMVEKCPKCASSVKLTGKQTLHQQVEIALRDAI